MNSRPDRYPRITALICTLNEAANLPHVLPRIPAWVSEVLVVAGQEAEVKLAIVNHEGETVDYRVEVSLDGVGFGEIDGIALKNGETWTGSFSFVPLAPGPDRALEFVLYKNGGVDVGASPLRLHVDVAEEP